MPVAAARVLKLDRPHRSAGNESAGGAWNLADFDADCDARVESARDRCRTLLAEAVAEADELRAAARAEGLAEGRTEGLRAAAAQIEKAAGRKAETLAADRLAAALPALEALTAAYAEEQQRWRARWEADAVALACGIAERLLNRTLAAHPDAAADLAAEALAAASGQSAAVSLHPDDLAALGETFAETVRSAFGPDSTLTADSTLSRGDCVVRTADGEIDGRLSARLDRIAAELLPAADGDDG